MINSFLERKSVNINLDTDGLLSYLFLKLGQFKGEVSGFNNSHDLILSIYPTLEEMWDDTFVDIYVGRKDVWSIDQHVVADTFEWCDYGENKINPHLLIENHIPNDDSYCRKFPFSTCLFILAYLEKEKKITTDINLLQPVNGKDFNLMDMVLRADGVLENYIKYNKNIKDWSQKLIVFSNNGINTTKVMDYLLHLSFDEAKDKSNKVSDFYISHGLTKDGGYNPKFPLKENIQTLNQVLRSFAKYLNVSLTEWDCNLYMYKGQPSITSDWKDLTLSELDTYAFVGKTKLSYTYDFKKSNNRIEAKIYD